MVSGLKYSFLVEMLALAKRPCRDYMAGGCFAFTYDIKVSDMETAMSHAPRSHTSLKMGNLVVYTGNRS